MEAAKKAVEEAAKKLEEAKAILAAQEAKDSNEFYQLDESYLAPGTTTLMMSIGSDKGYDEITLGDDEYYCLGDNRPVSNDSRNLGPFSADRVKGRAIFIAFPIGSIGLI